MAQGRVAFDHSKFRQWLCIRRKEHGLGYKRMAEVLGINRQQYLVKERGYREVPSRQAHFTLDQVLQICHRCGWTVSTFVNEG